MMKALVSLSLISVISFSLQARDLPRGLCDSVGECSPKQEAIFNRFMTQGQGIQNVDSEAVYSGSCFWNHPYNPNDEHHGALFFYETEKGNELAFKGRLSYYAQTNPYEDFTSEEARRYWFDRKKDLIPEQYEDYAFFDANPMGESKNRIWYWFRQDNQDAARVYMLAIFGSSPGFCELTRN